MTRDTGRDRSVRNALSGARGFRVALAVLVVVLAVMMIGPLESLSVANERVETLEARRAELSAEVDRLEERRTELQQPEEIEELARSELGLVAPGEVPFVVVTPQPDMQVLPEPQEPEPSTWYERLWQGVKGIFD